MPFPPHYLIALGSALSYAAATLMAKRATHEGAGALLLAAVGIISHPLCFWPLLLVSDTTVDWSQVHWPLLTALAMGSGFICVAGAIKLGDVSIQTPLAGTKALFVAIFAGLFTTASIPVTWWVGAALTTLGVGVIGLPELRRRHGSAMSVGLALLSASLFGVTDVMVQTHSQAFGPTPFIMVVLSAAAVFVAVVAPLMQRQLLNVPRSTWKWLVPFALLMGVQGAAFGMALAMWGNATALNIVYATRGFWSIALVWMLARRLAVPEADRSRGTMAVRLAGAALLFGAVVMVLLQPAPDAG